VSLTIDPTRRGRREGGSSMVMSLLILFAILALSVAALSGATSGLTLSNNYRTSLQAELAAESGLIDAVKVINNYGVVSFTTDVTPTSTWNTLYGSSAVPMPGSWGISYTVSPATSPTPSANNMTLSSSGQAPGQSQRTINVRLQVSQPFTCGAIDLPGSGVNATFNGTSFLVDGDDFAMGATTPTSGSTPTLGISTRSQSDANSVVSALSSGQQQDVKGTAVPGQVASVGSCDGPSPSRIANSIVPPMKALPNSKVSLNPAMKINGTQHFGTSGNPLVTYFDGDTEITATGNASGYGILIVNGSLTISGSLDFTGLVIVLGATQINGDVTTIQGSATVYGAIWTTDLSLTVGGNAGVRYSSDALSFANTLGNGGTPHLLPQRVKVLGWSQG
jgi:hypothetical protein